MHTGAPFFVAAAHAAPGLGITSRAAPTRTRRDSRGRSRWRRRFRARPRSSSSARLAPPGPGVAACHCCQRHCRRRRLRQWQNRASGDGRPGVSGEDRPRQHHRPDHLPVGGGPGVPLPEPEHEPRRPLFSGSGTPPRGSLCKSAAGGPTQHPSLSRLQLSRGRSHWHLATWHCSTQKKMAPISGTMRTTDGNASAPIGE